MKKFKIDFKIKEKINFNNRTFLLKLKCNENIPECYPGQFVELEINKANVLLRRPISINYIDIVKNELWLLIQNVGQGTNALSKYIEGDIINIILPLGNKFSIPYDKNKKILIIGGGVGIAPLLYLGSILKGLSFNNIFILLGAKTKDDILEFKELKKIGNTFITTEDGSIGEKGFVNQHSILNQYKFDIIYTCGPTPMMKAIAKFASLNNIECFVSLENKMACGLGACLCCVENTIEGNKCVCTEGPVFNIKDLKWQI